LKIPLSETQSGVIDPILRPVFDGPQGWKTSLLITNLLVANSNVEYRMAATDIREHLAPDQESSDSLCLHPDWFEKNLELYIDATTCMFCGYRKNCTLGVDEREFVEIINLDQFSMPSMDFFLENCFNVDKLAPEDSIDPFMGFSSRAGESRKLYLISQDEFNRQFPDGSQSAIEFDAAVGYDRITGQSIWSMDQLFLEVYERISGIIKFELNDSDRITEDELTMLDRKCLLQIAYSNGWLLNSDNDEIINQLHILFSRFISILKSKQIGPFLTKLTQINMNPRMDTPHSSSGSGYLNIAIRWIELKPSDLQAYCNNLDNNEDREIQKKLVSRIKNKILRKMSSDSIQYLPRFPTIVIAPESSFRSIKIEQPACRIIDVIESHTDQILLLIDGLGIDLLGEMKSE
jgi:hypothetical protein